MNPIVHTVYLSKFHHTGLCCLCKHCLIAMQADLHIAAVVLPGQPGIILGFSLIDAERRSLFFCFLPQSYLLFVLHQQPAAVDFLVCFCAQLLLAALAST